MVINHSASDQIKLGKQLRKIEEMEKKLENEKVTLKQGIGLFDYLFNYPIVRYRTHL